MVNSIHILGLSITTECTPADDERVILLLVQFEAARALVTNFTDIFGKGDGVRSKCPRCKGSGLLMGQSLWEWGQSSSSNAPCWFCDGYVFIPIEF